MQHSEDGGPAFPVHTEKLSDGSLRGLTTGSGEAWSMGMSLRDWFAGQALTGLAWAYGATDLRLAVDPTPILADKAYAIADAMLEARRKTDAAQ